MHVEYLLNALTPLLGLLALNIRGSHAIAPALLLGTIMWFLVLKSGVHATLAGVVTAFCIPLTDRFGRSPLHSLEHGLTPYVNFGIIPIFACAIAGVALTGLALSDLLAPLPLCIASGLVLSKMVGVFGITFLMVKFGLTRPPRGANWLHIYGISCLDGIGFTMSLFIGGLSFSDPDLTVQVRRGVLSGSLVSGVVGFTVLMLATRTNVAPEADATPDAVPDAPAEGAQPQRHRFAQACASGRDIFDQKNCAPCATLSGRRR